jgi:hypothetical protein
MGPSRRLIWWHSSRQLSVAFSVFFWLIVSSFRFCRRRDWVVEAVDLAVLLALKSVVGSKSVPVCQCQINWRSSVRSFCRLLLLLLVAFIVVAFLLSQRWGRRVG